MQRTEKLKARVSYNIIDPSVAKQINKMSETEQPVTEKKHVLFLSSAVFGHLLPLLQLARKTSQIHDVTFIVSQLRIRQLRERGVLTKEDEATICMVGLIDGLEESGDYEGSIEGLFAMIEKERELTDQLFPVLPCTADSAITNTKLALLDRPLPRPVDVVVAEWAVFFSGDVLIDRGVKCLLFYAFSALISINKVDVDENTPELPNDAFFSDWERYDDVSITGVPELYKKAICKSRQRQVRMLQGVSGFVCHSLEELEPDGLQRFQTHWQTKGRPVRFVAPLFGKEMAKGGEDFVNQWLDKQAERSVLYVSFGSTALPSVEQVQEIAKSLLLLKKPFIWSLKPAEHSHLPPELQASIASQSLSSTGLILPWVPQRNLLAHKSTGVFLTHAGWNSVLEGLDAGVPMVCWPLLADQYPNAERLVKRGVALTVPGTGMKFSRTVPAEEVVDIVSTVFGDDKFTRRAFTTGQIFKTAAMPGGSSYKAVHRFIYDDI